MKTILTQSSMRWFFPAIITTAISLTACKKSSDTVNGTVEGTVLNKETNQPIAGIAVQVVSVLPIGDMWLGAYDVLSEGTTGPDGKFNLRYKGENRNQVYVITKETDSIQHRAEQHVDTRKHSVVTLSVVHFTPAKVRLVVKKNDLSLLYVQKMTLPKGPLDTVIQVWGMPNTDVKVKLGVRDDAAGFFRYKAENVPIVTGGNTVTRIDIEDVSQWPRM